MTTIRDVKVSNLIDSVAKDLKENIKFSRPEWAIYVKTGAQKERQPDDEDWWWSRSASVLRKVAIAGPVGVTRLRTAYGGTKNRGHKPEEFRKASGKIIRTILQQFDEIGYTKKVEQEKGLAEKAKGFRGRILTPKGQAYLDKIAHTLKDA